MASNTLQRTVDRGTYVFEWFNDAGDRGMSALGKRLDRAARRSPPQVARPLRGAAKTFKQSDLSDVPAGLFRTVRKHPYGTILAGTAAVYLIQRWRRR